MAVSQGATCSGMKIMQLNDQKAGMDGLDKDMINRTIYEISKGTPYFTFQEKRQNSIDRKVKEVLGNLEKLTPTEKSQSLKQMDNLLSTFESSRDLSHSIVHIDMDAFFAAVEMKDNPELKEKPMAVGSNSMLSTSNYLARRFGVRAAMPGFIAKKLCPELIIVPCNYTKYKQVSKEIQSIVREYDPDYSASSLDEVYLDLTEYIKKDFKLKFHKENCFKQSFDSPDFDLSHYDYDVSKCSECQSFNFFPNDMERDERAFEIVQEVRQRIFESTLLTASAGIAPNTLLAKVCSDQNKPNGQFQVNSTVENVEAFITTLPVKKVSGIGPVQSQILNAIGIFTCRDLFEKRDIVNLLFTTTSVDFYMRVSLGIGSTFVKSDYIRKSIGTEETFRETHVPEELHKKCQDLCEEMIKDLRSHHMLGKVVILKTKTVDFVTHTRNHSLTFYTSDSKVIIGAAKKLLDSEITSAYPKALQLRLMGIRMANLIDAKSSNEKQCVKLTDFIQAKSPHSSNINRCPICCEELHVNSSAFNDHVNECINELCTSDRNECEDHFNEIGDANAFISKENNFSDRTTNNMNTRKSELTYICPVCGLEQTGCELTQFNAHIDICLNITAVQEILSEDDCLHNKVELKRKIPNQNLCGKPLAKKQKTSSRKIEEYFQ